MNLFRTITTGRVLWRSGGLLTRALLVATCAAAGAGADCVPAAAETAAAITEKAIQIAGGAGLMRHYPLQRFPRDARAGLIMPPNTEKCLEIAGKTAAEGKAGALMT